MAYRRVRLSFLKKKPDVGLKLTSNRGKTGMARKETTGGCGGLQPADQSEWEGATLGRAEQLGGNPTSGQPETPTTLTVLTPNVPKGKGINNTIVNGFIEKARIDPFESSKIPVITRPKSYNHDLELKSFTPSRYTWSGEQRKGLTCHITNSADAVGHMRKAMGLEFFLSF